MKRILAIVVGVVVAAGACGGGDLRPAATVNGIEISQQDVADDLEAIERNEVFLEAQEGAGVPVRGERSGTFEAAFAASVLNRRIQNLLVHQEVLDRDLEVTEPCREAARDEVLRRLGGSDPGAGEAVFEGFPEPFRSSFVEAEAEVLVLQSDLTAIGCADEDAAEAYFEDNAAQFRQACLSIIAVATQEEADEIADDLAAGSDFATTADDVGAGGGVGPGGDVGCVFRSEVEQGQPELAELVFAAQPGEVVGPVGGQSGFLLTLVRELRAPDFDDDATREQARQAVADTVSEAFRAWDQEAVAAAEVEVDPRYGRWDPTTGQLVPPDPPAPVPDEPDGSGAETGAAPRSASYG